MRFLNIVFVAVLIPLLLVPAVACALAFMAVDDGKPSVCYGNTVNGRLENGKRLLYQGQNYKAYHIAGYVTGRTFMHSAVRDTSRDAYAALAQSDPDLRFIYAESAWRRGGRLWPHKTHANGTSVDYMVPMRNDSGQVVELRGSVVNMLGYAITFDNRGRRGSWQIDFEAMAKHLLALDTAARANGIRIGRVIFEPPLHKQLFATEHGKLLQGKMPFMQTKAWVRHDQHYHVDFVVPCQGSGYKKRTELAPPAGSFADAGAYMPAVTAMSVTAPGKPEIALGAAALPEARSTE